VVEDIGQAVRGAGRIAELSRSKCRQTFEERFDAPRMAADYLEVYRRLKFSQPDAVEHAAHAFGTSFRGIDRGWSRAGVRRSAAVPHCGGARRTA
jgi:hypothetical protein